MNYSESICEHKLVPVTAYVRERIGCPANCSGKMIKKTVARKCFACGFFEKIY